MKKARWLEMIRFVFTGAFCFCVEFATMVFLKEVLHCSVMLSTALAFLLSVAVNYLLCIFWVFAGAKDSSGPVKAAFLLTTLVGFALNQGLMWLLCTLLGEDQVLFTLLGQTVSIYMLNKLIATLLVMIFNYFTKRFALTRGQQKQ